MILVFGSWIVWVPKVIHPGVIQGARIFFGIFLVLGLLVLVFSIVDTLRVGELKGLAGLVSDEQFTMMQDAVNVGDDLDGVKAKLSAADFGGQQVNGFVHRWVKPES